jgi:hypothetical protein
MFVKLRMPSVTGLQLCVYVGMAICPSGTVARAWLSANTGSPLVRPLIRRHPESHAMSQTVLAVAPRIS